MLTVDTSTLKDGEVTRLYVLEFDTEYGTVQTLGESGVCYYPPRRAGGPELESQATGGGYREPQMIADVQLWNAEDHFLAIFPDEQTMRAGGRQIAQEWGSTLPVGIHSALA